MRKGKKMCSVTQVVQTKNLEFDLDSMERLPTKDKCDVEHVMEYRFEGVTFHSMSFNSEMALLVVGTNKGSLLSFRVNVEPRGFMQESEVGVTKTSLIMDKDLADERGEVIFEKDIYKLE
jgi:hypothetical protein